MPLCSCKLHGCGSAGGRMLSSKRIFNTHCQKDKIAMIQQARDSAENALEEQVELISSHLDSISLTQKVTPPPSVCKQAIDTAEDTLEDQLEFISSHLASATLSDDNRATQPSAPGWSNASTESSDPVDVSATNSPSRRKLIRNLLERLSEIEGEIKSLDKRVDTQLSNADDPTYLRAATFPLQPLHLQCVHIQNNLEKIKSKVASVITLRLSVIERLQSVEEKINSARQTWKSEQKSSTSSVPLRESNIRYKTDHLFDPILPVADPIVQLSIFLVIGCQVILGTSRRGCSFIFQILRYIVQLCLMRNNERLAPRDAKVLHDFPVDPRTPEKHLHIEPKGEIFAVCPNDACQAAFAPKFEGESPIPIYPTYCSHIRYGTRCKEFLLRPRVVQGNATSKTIFVPIKPFVYFTPKERIANFLSQSEQEARMDGAWFRETNTGSVNEVRDIFDAEMLRNFTGPDGHLFGRGGDDGKEGRYVFSLSIDFFNPLSNKQAGKKSSVGIISLVCLNLPPEIRYKPENVILVGIIPGPREPPLDALNHFLKPLVDDFLELWDPGVWFTRTAGHPHGRLIRCALICLVCDLPAARKASGFAAFSHNHFCSVCHCTRKEDGYNNTDYHAWKRRTNEESRYDAEIFRNAKTKDEAEAALAKSGLRWSELLRLPYFDPSCFVIIDAMHNLFLGLVQEHFQGILGICLDGNDVDDPPVLNFDFSTLSVDLSPRERKSLNQLEKCLGKPLNKEIRTDLGMKFWSKKFSHFHLKVLKLVCAKLGCHPVNHGQVVMRREDFARALLVWRSAQQEADSDFGLRHGHVLTEDELNQIRADIAKMTRPSWLTSVPTNLGSASHGKLKADQWRVLGTTILPISLVQLWSIVEDGNHRSRNCRKLLESTFYLLSAVAIASSRTTSPVYAALYLQYMLAYLNSIKDIFPDYRLHPNHHMALHLEEYIRLYGPVHSWWTFPFERVIGMLQRISTNYKAGEYEQTVSRSFIQASNFKALMHKSSTPEVVLNCQDIFRKLVEPQIRDTLLTDMLSLAQDVSIADDDKDEFYDIPKPMAKHLIPKELKQTIQECFEDEAFNIISMLSHLKICGITYSVSSQHLGNCSILLNSGLKGKFLPARIEYICQLTTERHQEEPMTYVAAKKYKSAQIATDPFAPFPFLSAQLWSPELEDELELYASDTILSHFAHSLISWEGKEVMAIVSLLRVALC